MVWSIKLKRLVKIAIHLSAFFLFFNFSTFCFQTIFTIHSRGCVISDEVGVVPKMIKFISSKFIIPKPWKNLDNSLKMAIKNHMNWIMINLDSDKKNQQFLETVFRRPHWFLFTFWNLEKISFEDRKNLGKKEYFFSKLWCKL